ncbi:MAG: membrane-anchored protein YejM (alkaline phosphatase superfamily) [Bermanella sp.]|jgi:membrane-anchored protein YejM (alkaline phosphatase superfamily)
MSNYFLQVWKSIRSIGWVLLLNVALVTLVSLSFASYFPDSGSLLDSAYQIGLLPAVWGLYAILAMIVCMPILAIPSLRIPLMLLLATIGGTLAVIVFIDNYIYGIFNFHINWFFITAFLQDEGGEFFDVAPKTYFLFTFVSILVMLYELFIIWLVERKLLIRTRFNFLGVILFLGLFLNVIFINVTHSWAYAQNHMAITSISGHVPFYFPIHSRSVKKNGALASLAGDAAGSSIENSTINYPRAPMQCDAENDLSSEKPNIIMVVLESWRGDTLDAEVAPNTYAIAQESNWFKDHHSNGTVTTRGIFSLMYGMAPTYMDNVVAHNGAGGPVLFNVLKDKGYSFGIYPSGDITRIKLTDTSFLPVKEFVEHGEGRDTIEKDYDVLKKMIAKLNEGDDPVFGFMFFNSTHYLYYYPEEFEKFKPTKKPSLVDFKNGEDPAPFINRYKNSIYFIDSLIGELVNDLKESGKWDNTIFIITSDHAEEFADTQSSRFGHGSNYTRYQTHVPLVIHWPNKLKKIYEHRTASIDLSATLLQDALGCSNPISDFSNGFNLFSEESNPVQIMASYYNYAFVTEEGSFIQNPIGLLVSKDNEDKVSEDLKLKPSEAINALQQMQHFYKK